MTIFPLDLPPSSPAQVEDDEEIIIEHKTLDELNGIDPYEFPKSGCHCTVTVTAVPDDDSWWYLGCRACKKSSLEQVGGAPWCADCESSDFMPRYKLTFTATDTTAEGKFFYFDSIGRQIVKKSCESLFQHPTKGGGTPSALAAIVGNRCTFAVGLTTESHHLRGTRVYQIKCIMEDFQKRIPTPRSLAIEGSSKSAPSASLIVRPGTANVPTTPSSSSLMLDAPPTESPTPTKSAALPSGDQIMLSPTQNFDGQSSSAKPSGDLQPVHTPASHELARVEKRMYRESYLPQNLPIKRIRKILLSLPTKTLNSTLIFKPVGRIKIKTNYIPRTSKTTEQSGQRLGMLNLTASPLDVNPHQQTRRIKAVWHTALLRRLLFAGCAPYS